MSNTWPGGYRHALSQDAHRNHNATHYPGTRQICTKCDCETGNCEEDSLRHEEWRDGESVLCAECFNGFQEITTPASADGELT